MTSKIPVAEAVLVHSPLLEQGSFASVQPLFEVNELNNPQVAVNYLQKAGWPQDKCEKDLVNFTNDNY